MSHDPDTAQQRLAALIGRWRTEGWTIATASSPAVQIDATDTYEWLPGRFSILHKVDARVGEEHVEGAEIIGLDPTRDGYLTQYFGSDGPNAYDASLGEEEGLLVWSMRSATDRFKGRFNEERSTITGRWEHLDAENEWRPWMEVTLTRAGN
jgi:hypothetical protein